MKIMKWFLKAGKCLFVLFILVCLAWNIVNIVQKVIFKQDIPMIFGYGTAVVLTGSMEPVIRQGDMVLVHKQLDYQTDDIVTYKENRYITHRIVKKTENGYITQGEANNTADSEIGKSQVTGKVVWIIPKAGYVIDFLKSPVGMLVLVIGLLALIRIPDLYKKVKQR